MINEILHCWYMVAGGIYNFFAVAWPAFAIYGVLYALGAATFLVSLRLKSEDGKLIVNYDSTAYKLAHPLRWGQRQRDLEWYAAEPEALKTLYLYRQQGSICTFYASLFNMLLFIWPLILLYWIVATIVGSFVMLMVVGVVVYPDMMSKGWMAERQVFTLGVRNFPLAFVVGPLLLLIMAISEFSLLLRILGIIGMTILCIIPFAAVVALLAYGTRRVYIAQPGETASAVREVLVANKEKFCKLVEYK